MGSQSGKVVTFGICVPTGTGPNEVSPERRLYGRLIPVRQLNAGYNSEFEPYTFPRSVMIHGHENEDAKAYLEKQVRNAVKGKADGRVRSATNIYERSKKIRMWID